MKFCDEKQKAAHQAFKDHSHKEHMRKMQEQESQRRAEFDRRMQEAQKAPIKK